MCGITGICNYREDPEENIKKMNAKLIRRGPDAGGFWIEKNDRVVMGHRRLSIIDLTDNGSQPMVSKNERYVITFNGEIYNYKTLYRQMIMDGAQKKMRGESDTEILIEAIAFYGVKKALSYVKGMFAFALYDRKEKKIILARDRMGEKPLYYGKVNGSFVFASDLAAIKAMNNFSNPINTSVLNLYFHYGYIPQPYTIYKDIWKLPPGGMLEIQKPFDEWKISSYWNISEIAKKGTENLFQGSQQEATEEIERLLKIAINEQMVADVPVGAFLSGGIDSTTIVSLMQSISEKKIKTFTIGFEDVAYNEAIYAKKEAAILDTEHTEFYVGMDDVMNVIRSIPEAYSEPFADSSQIPTMLVSHMAKQSVTVSLSGDGGDELFCGYNTYKYLREGMKVLKSKGDFLPNDIRRSIGKVCTKLSGPHSPLLYKVGKVFSVQTSEDYMRAISERDCRIHHLLKTTEHLDCDNTIYEDGFLQEPEENAMLMDLRQYLPDDILTKVDRAGMFYSLENRIPLLDKDLIEFVWTLPLSYKYDGITTKKPLREILYRYMPKELMERPKKGFGMPIAEWLRKGEMHNWAEEIMHEAQPFIKDYINCKLVNSMWKDLNEKNLFLPNLWYILMYEQWILSQ